jgi:hypothetical protein
MSNIKRHRVTMSKTMKIHVYYDIQEDLLNIFVDSTSEDLLPCHINVLLNNKHSYASSKDEGNS